MTLLIPLHSEISQCAEKAGRDPASIQVIAVTKYASLEQMRVAYQMGLRHFGESRLQTALPKMAQLPQDIHWHFIGTLQSNKIGKIVEHFEYIHSVDSVEIATQIARKASKPLKLFLQVNSSRETTKHGFSEEELVQQVDALLALNLNFVGLMTMAPLTTDLSVIHDCFKRLRDLKQFLNSRILLPHLSMGMTQDFPIAIAEGATFVRIGSLLFKS